MNLTRRLQCLEAAIAVAFPDPCDPASFPYVVYSDTKPFKPFVPPPACPRCGEPHEVSIIIRHVPMAMIESAKPRSPRRLQYEEMTTPDNPDVPRPDEAGDDTAAGHGEKRSRLQAPAIAALLECQTIKQAAERVGISERTLRNWMREPDFAEAYRDARRDRVDRAVSRLETGFEYAIAVLQQVATNATSPPYARVAAARGLIDAGFKAVEVRDFAERLARIEARLLDADGQPRLLPGPRYGAAGA